ncbi:hypothetical protein RB653_003795 [Dictyostelium firmibasis]|uniref:2-phosphoglycerate kinase n=1 Tax=Dictyostelium firmibasis TaxID=79012 RepID=A0AAN7TZS8_9MYCE
MATNNKNNTSTNENNQFLHDMKMVIPPSATTSPTNSTKITTTTTTTTTTSTMNAFDKLQQSPTPSEHKMSLLNSLNQPNRLRTLNRASSLQNLSTSSDGSRNHIDKHSMHLHGGVKNKEEQEQEVEDKFNLIKFDASNSNHPTPSSKYDFVKVKVQLENHYYVLSRFLISRVLNVTKVDAADSVKISLALKKTLVDQGRLTITQPELENELFKLLQAYGYGKEYIERYKMTTQFHHQRVPLIILISGPKYIGKSWLATQLAERLNLSTVLQTTLVHDLMFTIIKEFQPKSSDEQVTGSHPSNLFGMPSDPPIVFKNHKSKEELLTEFKKECIMIRHGVDTDIEKCFEEGKAIIIEGPHIDPSLFIELIAERNMISPIQFVFEKTQSNEDLIKLELEKQMLYQQQQDLLKQRNLKNNSYSFDNTNFNNNNTNTDKTNTNTNINENINNTNTNTNVDNNKNNIPIVQTVIPDEIPPSINENNKNNLSSEDEIRRKKEEKESKKLATAALINSLRKPKAKGIVIPFVLSIDPKDHRFLIENWLSTSPYDQANAEKAFGPDPAKQTESILNNLQTIQDYLCTGVPPFQRVEVNAHCLLETLDVLHSAVLKRINTAYSGHVKGFDYES